MTKSYAYDSIGNITNKSDVGGYIYGEDDASPLALTTANNGGAGFHIFILFVIKI
ncbi:MAG: hypothetical protein GY792_19445 [Gammaproteobacteria bacterium]|nr:hypothetical protein [Gammaproteobacteria bacterium]